MNARIAHGLPNTKRGGRSALFALCLLSALVGACDDGSGASPAPIQDLAVLDGSYACEWGGPGENAICRDFTSVHTTAALEYPVLLMQQGWQRMEGGGESLSSAGHGGVLWFERRLDNNCLERISLELIPAPPLSEDTNPMLLIHTDYEPECDGKRSAQ